MGRNSRSSKMYGKVVSKDNSDRPGWRGPGYTKPKAEKTKAKPPPTTTNEDEAGPDTSNLIPFELQQLLLNIFRDVFSDILTSDTLQPTLQEVKTCLYNRDFLQAFGKSEYLEAYSVRWSPSRALCYQSILADIEHLIRSIPIDGRPQPTDSSSGTLLEESSKTSLRVACFGGGAAEEVAFGGFIKYLQISPQTQASADDEASITHRLKDLSVSSGFPKTDLLLLDVAHWEDVVQKLHTGLISPPTLSKYANASAREANVSLLAAENLSTAFRVEDLLALSSKQLAEDFGQSPMLLTLLFTLNELYTASIGKTTAFLLNLTAAVKPGTLLLVVDSPGSYSETTVGTEAKKYPMQWLLNHTLIDSQKAKEGEEEKSPLWIKEVSEHSKWFRLPDGLRYPIPLENMRYQIHLYRRV